MNGPRPRPAPEASGAPTAPSESGLHHRDDARRREAPPAKVLYRAILGEGEQELRRPASSLFWSGLAAGLALYISVVTRSLLHHEVGQEPFGEVLSGVGYSVGFLVVVFGRLQLFTEATVTAVLPVAARPTIRGLAQTARLWSIVLVANLLGVFVAAAMTVYFGQEPLLSGLLQVSRPLMEPTWAETAARGLPAGFIIAAMVWMLPNSRGSRFWIVVTLTSVIAFGHFTHVIAGSGEMFVLWLVGESTAYETVFGFVLPALLGNIVGGTVLFALLAHAQVREEL